MIKLLFLTNNLRYGGAEKALVNLTNHLADDGYDVTIRVLSNSESNIENLSKKVKFEYIYSKYFRGMNYLHLLPRNYIYKKIAKGNFDIIIVYLHGVLTKIISYAPAEQKTIAYLHANMQKSRFIKSFRTKESIVKCFANYNRIVSAGSDIQDSFIAISGIKDKRLTIKYNVYDTDDIKEKGKDKLYLDKVRFIICSVGKLEQVKGYDRLIRVANKLIKEGYKISLYIVGDGPQRNELENYIEDHSLSAYIKLVGFDANPYKYIASSKLFVSSSYSEGYSSVIAESLILGVPALATDCAGTKELLGNGEYGIIVENSEEALYEGLKKLISDKALLNSYKKKAEDRSEFFSANKTVKEFEQMIEEVISE